MQNIVIGRYDRDPQAQGVIRPEDGSWQLVLDKDGYPHLYIQVRLEPDAEGAPKTGLLAVEDMMDASIPDLMKSSFGGKLSPEDEQKAYDEHMARLETTGRPCPR